jgi:hypothetical protein
VNARKNVPNVDGAGIQPPNSRPVRLPRSTPVSSMLSAPSTIANSSAITLRPVLAAPGRSRRSRTRLPVSASKTEPLRERRDQRHPRVADDPLVIDLDPHTVQSGRPVIIHRQGDLLTPGPGCPHSLKKPCSGGHSSFPTGRNAPTAAVDPG